MKIIVTDPMVEKGLAILKGVPAEVDVRAGIEAEELAEVIGDYDAIIIRSRTRLTAELIRKGTRLKVIGRAGVGLDNIDVAAATEQGILVMNSPGGNTISTCELTMGMILCLSRRIPEADTSMKAGEWKRKSFMGTELYGKTLGIIGLGKIGREVARRAAAFGMKLIGYDPYATPESLAGLDIELVELNELYRTSDIITLHIPLTDETRHLIGAAEFEKMKPGVKIINCARGGIIDEQALYAAIQNGTVSGCGLDVYEQEPPTGNPLLALPQVTATPHMGAKTPEAQERVAVDVAQHVAEALQGKPGRNAVNFADIECR